MQDLIERADRAEARAWEDMVEAASPQARQAAGVAVEAIGQARLLSASALDTIFLNRVIGLRGDDLDGIRRALRQYAGRGATRYFLHLGPAARDERVAALLRSYGVERYHRSWDKFIRDARCAPPDIATDLVIREATAADAGACGDMLARVFDAGPLTSPIFSAVIGRPSWRVFVGVPPEAPDGRPVSVGGLFLDGEVGYLAFGATDPAHRRRGGQGAIMARRIREAAALGCRWLTTETGEPVPADPSPSHRNMLRCGFTILQRRDNYAPIGFTWTARQASG